MKPVLYDSWIQVTMTLLCGCLLDTSNHGSFGLPVDTSSHDCVLYFSLIQVEKTLS